MKAVILAILLFAVVIHASKDKSLLERYYTVSGGFKPSDKEAPNMEGTSVAVFLATLFGIQGKIPADTVYFIGSLNNGDHGYSSAHGQGSDLESTRYAVAAMQNLRGAVHGSGVAAYVQSLYHADTHLYSNRLGQKGDLKSTALAYHLLSMLNVKEKNAIGVNSHLKSLLKDAEGYHFVDSSFAPVAGNYYGILLGKHSGFGFDKPEKWVAYILSQQSRDGGFYSDSAKSATSIEATWQAVESLHLIDPSRSYLSNLKVQELKNFLKTASSDLRTQAQVTRILAILGSLYDVSVSYDVGGSRVGVEENTIVQGSKVRPALSISAHGNILTDMSVGFSVNQQQAKVMEYYADRRQYVAGDFLDANTLGDLIFTYYVKVPVAEFGALPVTVTDKKSVGYGMTLVSSANLAGKELREGESVAVGTDFTFSFTLFNTTNSDIRSGPFTVDFNVLDSSNVVIHTKSVSGQGNSDNFKFQYSLSTAAIPAGPLYAQFQVAGSEGVHTTKRITYNLGLLMIASEIDFGGVSSYKLGDTLKVSMVPASFPDLRTVYPYSASAAAERDFYLDIATPNGVVINSVRGVVDQSAKEFSKYVFTHAIAATLEEVGNHVVSFRYVADDGSSVHLSNYDSSTKELYEENQVQYSVDAELHVFNVQEKPTKGDFYYGNEILYKLQVKDTVSGKTVVAGAHANLFLELKHTQQGKAGSFVSALQPAVNYHESNAAQGFYLSWSINPNAVKGNGVLSLVIRDADGTQSPVYEEKAKTAVQMNVNIGGDIAVASNVKTVANSESTQSVFLVDFTLKCEDKQLKGAQLRANVLFKAESSYEFEQFVQLPVGSNAAGVYETSYVAAHKDLPSGTYKFQFFREVDLSQSDSVKPLFELESAHETVQSGQLPIHTEFLFSILFGAAFVALYSKLSKYTK